jgi:hypothetical protein
MKWIASVCLALAAALALGQQGAQDAKQQKQDKQDKQAKDDDQPLFTKKIGYKSSTTTKESATLGFNGIDPSGRVSSSMLAASPGAAEVDRARKMSASVPMRGVLLAFLKEGGLNSK